MSLPRIARGEGSYLYDTTGRRYLDGSGAPAAFGIGHDNPEVNATIASQSAGRMRIPISQQRAARRADPSALTRCGADFEPIVYSLSGSEAVESAMKVALQYWDARGQRAKRRFIARQRSYHGNTLGALSLSGFLELRSPFEGSLVDVEVISAASDYRPLDGLRGAALTDALAFFRRINRIVRKWQHNRDNNEVVEFSLLHEDIREFMFLRKSVCLMRSKFGRRAVPRF